MKKTVATVVDMGYFPVEDPLYGNLTLNLFPFRLPCRRLLLPNEFKLWEPAINRLISIVTPQPEAPCHFITIDSQFFAVSDTLRREGVHMDGNFCVDPSFGGKTWGGATPTWGGATPRPLNAPTPVEPAEPTPDDETRVADTPWVSPYNLYPPYGQYISGDNGGILCVSSYSGCRVWEGEFPEPGDGGACDAALFSAEDAILFKAHNLYFMTSNTPHQSLPIPAGTRRTLFRLTLDHRFDNRELISRFKPVMQLNDFN